MCQLTQQITLQVVFGENHFTHNDKTKQAACQHNKTDKKGTVNSRNRNKNYGSVAIMIPVHRKQHQGVGLTVSFANRESAPHT